MGWLENLAKTTIYKYKDVAGEIVSGTLEELHKFAPALKGKSGESFVLADHVYFYEGFEPKELGIMTKTTFEKNGRKAVKITHRDGKNTIRSMTRENLMKGKGLNVTGDKRDAKGNKTGEKAYEVDSALTKGCRTHSNEVKADMVNDRLQRMKQEVTIANQKAKEKKK